MIFGSVCSGIEAASCAWEPLSWRAAFYSEIEPFPRAVLAHHFPEVPLLGDFTAISGADVEPIDLLVGGTPCKDFSVAGLRAGLDGKHGQLTIEFVELARRLRPRWLVWENVPGVLSADDGRAFGIFLGALGKLGYGFAYRVLDAQYFGVPQRRRRVFVVGYFGDWRRAAAVLFERHSLSGHPAPRRAAGQVAPTIPSRSSAGGGLGTDFDCDGGLIASDIAPTLSSSDAGVERTGNERTEADFLVVTHALTGEGHDASEDGRGRGTPLVAQPIVFDETQITSAKIYSHPRPGDPSHPLASGALAPTIAYTIRSDAFGDRDREDVISHDQPGLKILEELDCGPALAGAIGFGAQVESPFLDETALRVTARNGDAGMVAFVRRPADVQAEPTHAANARQGIRGLGSAVRRLTPRQRECERLMGFPDDYSLVPYRGKPAADAPRYRALGNSMAVPVMRWIGEWIAMVDAMTSEDAT